ncbi:glycosyl transferase [Paenibacillus sp. JMULE4]|uniref:glycosyl transferase n=2 Tax=Paenibacillus TaxID=44249 RepID=UPI000B1B776C|nr:glycosyl transferase [Paenibacillus sp. JMULE4]NTZ20086.1 glycosyl transferase [Paenibacillus sp. JMULE4]
MNPSSVSFRHMFRLTDDTGIVEHALGRIPRRQEGYSTDDQARALWACLEWLDYVPEKEADGLHSLIDTYLSFLLWTQNENGHFHNNIAFDRTREAETPSDDCLGRCLWASALAFIKLKDRERALAAKEILEKAMNQVANLQYLRGSAYAMAAISLLIRHNYPRDLDAVLAALAAKLLHAYRTHARPQWLWYEPALSYSNGIIPWGLFCAYEAMKNNELLDVAVESLDFLIRLSLNEKGHIRPVGNRGWCTPEYRALWDQQPIDVMKLALAASKAYEMTGKARYAEIVGKCRGWFYGENDAGVPMCNALEGSGYDGLGEKGPNLNQGAESTLSYLLTEAVYLKLNENKRGAENYAAYRC